MTTRTFAMILIKLGILALVYQGIQYTMREKVVDLSALQLTTEKTRSFPVSPLLGFTAVVVGVALLRFRSRQTA